MWLENEEATLLIYVLNLFTLFNLRQIRTYCDDKGLQAYIDTKYGYIQPRCVQIIFLNKTSDGNT